MTREEIAAELLKGAEAADTKIIYVEREQLIVALGGTVPDPGTPQGEAQPSNE